MIRVSAGTVLHDDKTEFTGLEPDGARDVVDLGDGHGSSRKVGERIGVAWAQQVGVRTQVMWEAEDGGTKNKY